MSDNLDLLKELAIDSNSEDRSFLFNDRSFDFAIARLVSVEEMLKIREVSESRERALKAKKGKLPVVVTAEMIEGREKHFPDAVKLDGGKFEIYVDGAETVNACTLLEYGIRSPELTWAEAVCFSRLNGPLVMKIIKAFREINSDLMEEEAKNA